MILFTEQLQRANSKYPIVDSKDVKGGLWTVDTIEELESLSQTQPNKLQDGMLAFVKSLDIYYQYKNSNWEKASFNSSGIPIYTQDMLDDLSTKPENYITIHDPQSEIKPENFSYLDTMFSAIRKLQAEVAKLKNSFRYGINSYTETDTAMSSTMNAIQEQDNEPLWALEEEDLSMFEEATVNMDGTHQLQDSRDVHVDNELGLLTIGETTVHLDTKDFKDVVDSKSIMFITSTGKDIKFELKNATQSQLNIDLTTLEFSSYDLYNILIVISKKTTKSLEDPNLYGFNYIWLQITDAKTNTVIISGYYNGTTKLQTNLHELTDSYYLNKIYFKNLILSKVNAYTKAQDFSYEVIPSIPNETDYKLGVAHLTIRSVSTEEVLDYVKDQLQSNELIWVESTRSLCIKSNGVIYSIGGNKNSNTMTQAELIATLANLGIIVTNVDNGYNLELADVSGITFIHQDTGKKFTINIDAEGNLRSTPEVLNLISDRLKNKTPLNVTYRGFLSRLRLAEDGGSADKDAKLKSDRLKIGAVYAPQVDRFIYGCSHAYVELENTSDQDIALNGCYLHVAMPNDQGVQEVKTLALKGTIPAGGTFLIRGKQYAEYDDVNTIIKVKSFDQEWYVNNQLIDFQKADLQFLLAYNIPTPDLNASYIAEDANTLISDTKCFIITEGVIDGMWVRSRNTNNCSWFTDDRFLTTDASTTRDYILKNTFELDPAKQAFQALCPCDSSRLRGVNKNDFKPFYIDTPFIEFPNSTPIYDVSLITPKASFEHKNVSTDKTKLDKEKPNMVYCSFGIDMHTTRCFNWISVGSFDEYVWVREQGTTDWNKFESYKTLTKTETEDTGDIVKKEFTSLAINNNVYARMQGRFPGDGSFYTAHKCIIKVTAKQQITTYEYIVGRADVLGNPDEQHTSQIQTFMIYPQNTLPRVYHITDQQGFYWIEYQTWAGAAKVLANKILEDIATDHIMPVIINTGDVTQNGTRVNEWLDYYLAGYDIFKQFEHMSVVGNNDLCGTDPSLLGTGDDVGKSNSYYHHLFNCYEIDTENLIVNSKYIPSTYYFDCIVNDKTTRFININSEITFINCRDWFGLSTDNSDVAYNIYTGWTTGNDEQATNYQYATNFTPIYNTLYTWLNATNTECIVACHEIPFTVMTRQNMSITQQSGYRTYSRSVDGKSGALVGSHLNQLTKSDNVAMYWFSRLLEHFGVKICLGGHKHTYTCTYPVREFYFYEDKNSLSNGPMPMQEDLSDEYSNGQHKVTWEYTKNDDSLLVNNAGTFGRDNFNCFIPEKTLFNTSRLPIVKFEGTMLNVSYANKQYTTAPYSENDLSSKYLPIIGYPAMDNGVIYFMCQATGYKQTSNKELPGAAQAFSQLLPLTQYDSTTNKDTASNEQQAPMFGVLKWGSNNQRILQLARIMNIQQGLKQPLYTDKYSVEEPFIQYINCISDDYIKQRFGTWATNESNILSYEV